VTRAAKHVAHFVADEFLDSISSRSEILARIELLGAGREHFANFVEYEKLYGLDDGSVMQPFAPRIDYDGVGGDLVRLLRSAVSPIVDVRDPIQKARARLAARSELVLS